MSLINGDKVKKLLQSKTFWVSFAALTSVTFLVTEWYRDRYTTPNERFLRIKKNYEINTKLLCKLRKEFVHRMTKRMEINNNIDSNNESKSNDEYITSTKYTSNYMAIKQESTIKMSESKIRKYPSNNPVGLYYTLDWGGTNFRILRIQFNGNNKPDMKIFKTKVDDSYLISDNETKLFDYLSNIIKDFIIKNGDDITKEYKVGFTFSFPMKKKSINEGILIEWTKGYKVSNCEGYDISKKMSDSFKRVGINGNIVVICNDTVSALLACKYTHNECRMGVILGTGSNACYMEPTMNDEIINIEWGGFGSILLPRMPIDFIMDQHTPHPNKQSLEKLVSGLYIGELVRLLSIEVFRERIVDYESKSAMNTEWGFPSEDVSLIIDNYNKNDINQVLNVLKSKYNLANFTINDCVVFSKICVLLLNRSCDLAAAMILGALEKTGLYTCHRNDDNNPYESDTFELTDKYKNDKNLKVIISCDGSLYEKAPNYQKRLNNTMKNIIGNDIYSRIQIILQKEGSLIGPAVAALAIET